MTSIGLNNKALSFKGDSENKHGHPIAWMLGGAAVGAIAGSLIKNDIDPVDTFKNEFTSVAAEGDKGKGFLDWIETQITNLRTIIGDDGINGKLNEIKKKTTEFVTKIATDFKEAKDESITNLKGTFNQSKFDEVVSKFSAKLNSPSLRKEHFSGLLLELLQ